MYFPPLVSYKYCNTFKKTFLSTCLRKCFHSLNRTYENIKSISVWCCQRSSHIVSISSLSFYKTKVLFGFSFLKFHNPLYNPNAIFILFSNTLLLVIVVFVLLISFTAFCFSGPNKSMLDHFSKLFLRCEGKELSGCGISLIPWYRIFQNYYVKL